MINKMLVVELSKYGKVYIDFPENISDEFKSPLLEVPNTIDVRKKYGFSTRTLSFYALYRYIKLLKRENVTLISRSPGPLNELSRKVRLGFSLINLLGKIFGGKVIYFGNCCSEAYAKALPMKSTFMDEVFVREKSTIPFAKKYLKCPVFFIPDMAFLMYSSKTYKKKKSVIVDFRVSDKCDDRLIDDIKDIITKFLFYGYKVELYYQVKSDKEAMEYLYEHVKTEGVSIRHEILWYDEIESYYSDKAYVISNRLHSLLFGAAYSVIPIARISTDSKLKKIRDVFESSLPEVFCENIDFTSKYDVSKVIEHDSLLREKIQYSMQYNKIICSNTIAECLSRIK